MMVHKVLPVQLEQMVMMELKVLLELLDKPEPKVLPAHPELLVKQELQDH